MITSEAVEILSHGLYASMSLVGQISLYGWFVNILLALVLIGLFLQGGAALQLALRRVAAHRAAVAPAVTPAAMPVTQTPTPPHATPVVKPKAQGPSIAISSGMAWEIECVSMMTVERETKNFDRSQLAQLTEVGSGGEGSVFKAADGTAWKIFHDPQGPYFQGNDPEILQNRANAHRRLSEVYPCKLPQFPVWLSRQVLSPRYYLKDVHSSFPISGYAMPYLEGAHQMSRFAEPEWREKNGVTVNTIARAYLSLYDVLCEAHACGVLLKDLKPENVLVKDNKAFIVDGESLDFGGLDTGTFTPEYADWRLCDRGLEEPTPIKAHDKLADWYAFAVMLFQGLTCVHPYAGRHRPQTGVAVPNYLRAREGVSILNADVKAPPFMKDLNEVLTKELREYFYRVFEQGMRGRPDRSLIERLVQGPPPTVLKPLTESSWKFFNITPGLGTFTPAGCGVSLATTHSDVLCAKLVKGNIVELKRSGDKIVPSSGTWQLRDQGQLYNWFDIGTEVSVFGRCRRPGAPYDGPFHFISSSGTPGKEIQRVSRGLHRKPNIAPQGDTVYWHNEGRLHASNATGCLAEISGSEVTLLSGDLFGLLVVCRNGELDELFLFGSTVDKEVKKLVGFPPIFGTIRNIDCSFCESTAWLFITAEWNSQKIQYVLVVDASGKLYAMGATEASSVAWHSVGALRAAYHKKAGNASERGLVAVVGDKLVKVICRDQKVVPVSHQMCSSPTRFERILADDSEIRLERAA